MSKERELLRRALEVLDEKVIGYEITKGAIRTYLSTPSDDAEEPVAWMFETDRGPHYFRTEKDALRGASLYGNYVFKPLYLHPPKPAESEAEIIETLKAENFKLASGQCTEGGPWGDEGGTPYCKYAARKPMTEEEISVGLKGWDWHPARETGFYLGIRYAEKHHGIGGDDDKQG